MRVRKGDVKTVAEVVCVCVCVWVCGCVCVRERERQREGLALKIEKGTTDPLTKKYK